MNNEEYKEYEEKYIKVSFEGTAYVKVKVKPSTDTVIGNEDSNYRNVWNSIDEIIKNIEIDAEKCTIESYEVLLYDKEYDGYSYSDYTLLDSIGDDYM